MQGLPSFVTRRRYRNPQVEMHFGMYMGRAEVPLKVITMGVDWVRAELLLYCFFLSPTWAMALHFLPLHQTALVIAGLFKSL